MAWLSGWSYRKEITINGQSGAGTNYQVDLDIGDSAGGDFHLEGHCTNFPQDIIVTDNDGTTLLDFWIKDITADPITMWIEVADDLGSNQTIYVYYTKSGATTDSDITTTFAFGDDGEDHSDGDGLKTTGGWIQGNTFNGNGINEYSNDRAYSGSISLHLEDSGGEIYHSSSLTELPQILECELYVPSTDLSTKRSYFSIQEGSASWAYSTGASLLSHGTNWYVGYGGTEYITTKSLTVGWHKLTIKAKSDGSADMYVDDILLNVSVPSATLDNSDNKVVIGTYIAGYHSYFDNIRVRKYIATEPAFSSAGSEETLGWIGIINEITNPASIIGIAVADITKVNGI